MATGPAAESEDPVFHCCVKNQSWRRVVPGQGGRLIREDLCRGADPPLTWFVLYQGYRPEPDEGV